MRLLLSNLFVAAIIVMAIFGINPAHADGYNTFFIPAPVQFSTGQVSPILQYQAQQNLNGLYAAANQAAQIRAMQIAQHRAAQESYAQSMRELDAHTASAVRMAKLLKDSERKEYPVAGKDGWEVYSGK